MQQPEYTGEPMAFLHQDREGSALAQVRFPAGTASDVIDDWKAKVVANGGSVTEWDDPGPDPARTRG
ncbi:hypothetical protein ACFYNM_21510 [Streptomyces spororaveus]|uniref:hypothetical protein n=1 Tax=Streptomyces spororaveus TaxID=284039 RepID=UPI0036B9621F